MNKGIFAGFVALAAAQTAEPDWQPTEEHTTAWKTCSKDSDCAEDYACVKGLFQNTEAVESGSFQGCNGIDVCKGTGTWLMRTETFQVFCSDEMKEKAEALPDPEGITAVSTPLASEWSPACSKASECSTGQGCYPYYYQWDDSMDDFDNGVICMPEAQECVADPSAKFALRNADFATTEAEYQIDFMCSFSGASAIAATLVAAITAVALF